MPVMYVVLGIGSLLPSLAHVQCRDAGPLLVHEPQQATGTTRKNNFHRTFLESFDTSFFINPRMLAFPKRMIENVPPDGTDSHFYFFLLLGV